MKKKDKNLLIAKLTILLDKGVIITDALKEAIESTITAIKDGDLNLAYQISACKSLISDLECERELYAFRENTDANKKKLGYSVYNKLDEVHHDLAWYVGSMPSGMIMVSADRTAHSMESVGTHPIVQRISFEKEQLRIRMTEDYKRTI
jgi:hypothetical protein